MERWCFDIDGTICEEKPKGTPYGAYADVEPFYEVIEFINKKYDEGHYIILNTARHMVSTNGNLGLINQRIGKITLDWLEKHGVKYHEIYFAKPYADFYVDDKAVNLKDLFVE